MSPPWRRQRRSSKPPRTSKIAFSLAPPKRRRLAAWSINYGLSEPGAKGGELPGRPASHDGEPLPRTGGRSYRRCGETADIARPRWVERASLRSLTSRQAAPNGDTRSSGTIIGFAPSLRVGGRPSQRQTCALGAETKPLPCLREGGVRHMAAPLGKIPRRAGIHELRLIVQKQDVDHGVPSVPARTAILQTCLSGPF
jgi:hypothetical protein